MHSSPPVGEAVLLGTRESFYSLGVASVDATVCAFVSRCAVQWGVWVPPCARCLDGYMCGMWVVIHMKIWNVRVDGRCGSDGIEGIPG